MAKVVASPPLEAILAFCAAEPIERVFLEDIARRGLGQFVAVEERGRLTALCHAGVTYALASASTKKPTLLSGKSVMPMPAVESHESVDVL